MRTSWVPARVAAGAALAAWAATFWALIATDRTAFYFSPRTAWLAPVGAVTLTVAAAGRLVSARASTPRRERAGLGALAILVAPAVLVTAFPPATLGAYAVSRRSSAVKGAYVSAPERDLGASVSLVDIFRLGYSGELERLVPLAGTVSTFTGFVTDAPGDGPTELRLNRFLITCCPGDAVNVQVRVVGAPPGRFERDDWVRVTGRIYPIGKEVVVDADEIVAVPRPERPYLSP